VQVAVDVRHKLNVGQQVTNQVVDMGLLTETAEPAGCMKRMPGERLSMRKLREVLRLAQGLSQQAVGEGLDVQGAACLRGRSELASAGGIAGRRLHRAGDGNLQPRVYDCGEAFSYPQNKP
jgi:hypothetical protein